MNLRALLSRWRRPIQAAPARAPQGLARIIRPEVGARWFLPSLRYLTPEYVESVLRGALSGSHVSQWELFDLMEDTWPRLATNLNKLKRSVLALDWKVEAWHEEDAPPTPQAEERAKLISRLVWTMQPRPEEQQTGFEGMLYDLLDAWAKGVSLVELGFEPRSDRKLGDVIGLQSAWWVAPHNYAWSSDGWLGLQVPGKAQTLIRLPEYKFLVAICRAKTSHPIQGALLRPLAWWWCAANFSADWLLNLAQVFGLPIRWAQYDASAPQAVIDSLCAMLENMGSAGWAAFPAGTQLDLKEPTKTGDSYPQSGILDRADKQADLLILGSSGTMDVGQTGTQALGTVHQDVQADVVQSAAEFLAGVLNLQLVPAVLRWNYGDAEDAPEFCPEPQKIEDQKANAERDTMLLDRGIELPKAWFYDRHKIPLPAEGEEVISKPAPAPAPGFGFPTPGGPEAAEEPEDDARSPAPGAQADSAPEPPEADAEEEDEMEAKAIQAKNAATEKLLDNVLEDLTGVQARWLAGVRPFFRELLRQAESGAVSDTEFEAALVQAQRQIPELFGALDRQALADAFEGAMGAACANGALQGYMRRRPSGRSA